MSLVIKAFLERDGNAKAEIRRFGVPADASASYTYVFKKVSEVFPGLVTGNFNLYWKDGDGDLISFSTDEELLEALGFVTDSVFRIYIKEHAQPASGSSSSSNVLHPGVVCDGCEGPVRGIRYKCCVCPDYDLCSQCEAANRHPEHDMWKIVNPVDHGGAARGNFRPPPQFRRWMKKYMNRWHSRQGECGTADEQCSSQENAGTCQGETNPEEEYLNDVGENVAAMLDPFGVNVTFEVEHNGRRRPCRGNGRHGCRRGLGGYWGFGPRGHGHGHGFANCPRRRGNAPDSATQCTPQGNAPDCATQCKPDDEMKTCEDVPTAGTSGDAGEKTSQAEAPVMEKLKELQINEDSHGGNIDADGDWQVVSDKSKTSSPKADHPDAKITEALNQMMQMGFSNDGGWLTRLLEAKNGDISKVLDAIKPDPRNGSLA